MKRMRDARTYFWSAALPHFPQLVQANGSFQRLCTLNANKLMARLRACSFCASITIHHTFIVHRLSAIVVCARPALMTTPPMIDSAGGTTVESFPFRNGGGNSLSISPDSERRRDAGDP